MKISELKKEAKVKLSGCYKLVLGIYLISSLIISIVSLITSRVTGFLSFILSILGIIVTFAFGYGIADSNLKLSRNVQVGITDFITVGFKNLKRTFFLFLTLFVKLLIPIILLTVASVLPIVANFVYDAESSGYTLLSLGGSLLTILALIYFLYKVMSFVLAIYILVDNQEMKGKEAVIKSAELMKGNKTNFIAMVFSFIGWFLLIGIISGIVKHFSLVLTNLLISVLYLFLNPYITFTEIGFYEEVNETPITQKSSTEEPSTEEPTIESNTIE